MVQSAEKKLSHRYIRITLGVSNQRQLSERITMGEVRRRWGDKELATDKVRKGGWNGMGMWQGHRLPKSCFLVVSPSPTPGVVLATIAVYEVVCEVCFRMFRRESDRKRNKCVAVRNVGQPSARSVNLDLGAEVGFHRCRPGS